MRVDRQSDTDQLHTALNDLYDHLVTIQNAGDLELAAGIPANAAPRAKLLLATFPPASPGKAKQTPTPPAPQPPASPAP